MQNAKDAAPDHQHRILNVGRTGSGKTAQIWTLPGKKFAYIFDPNTMATLRGCDVDIEIYNPDILELDATIKGFNKGSKSDAPATDVEPTVYMRWVEDLNERVAKGFFSDYDWLCFDSLTFLSNAVMARNMWLNKRYGGLEDQADYRIVGNKLSEVFLSINSLPINIYATGHLRTFQDDKTKKIEITMALPGKARGQLPLTFTDVFQASVEEGTRENDWRHVIRTKPDPRGLQDIRTSMPLNTIEDVTIKDFGDAERFGIGALLRKHTGV